MWTVDLAAHLTASAVFRWRRGLKFGLCRFPLTPCITLAPSWTLIVHVMTGFSNVEILQRSNMFVFPLFFPLLL